MLLGRGCWSSVDSTVEVLKRLDTYSFKSSIRSPPSSKAMDPESSMYSTISKSDSLTWGVSCRFTAITDRTDEIGGKLLGHTPFSGNLVQSSRRSDLGGDHVERALRVERLDVLLSVSG
jgi:hypothetical protein